MKVLVARTLFFSTLVLLPHTAPAQDIFKNIFTTGWGDVADIKQKAEAGNAAAQHKLADLLASRFRPAEALQWYGRAAQQSDLEAFYQVGRLLLHGAVGIPADQGVLARPAEGIFIVYRAATNGHHEASHDLSRAYKEGRGVAKDLVQAYAWLEYYTDTGPPSFMGNRVELNELAFQVDTATSQKGKRLAALYRSGKWPTLVVQPTPEPKPAPMASPPASPAKPPPRPAPRPAPNLKLNGIIPGQNPLAIINGKSLAAGETATIPAKPQSCVLKCLSIEPDSVVVFVDGESGPRTLRSK